LASTTVPEIVVGIVVVGVVAWVERPEIVVGRAVAVSVKRGSLAAAAGRTRAIARIRAPPRLIHNPNRLPVINFLIFLSYLAA
jgi:hypothetical protein